jgi:hypothetical protein
MKTVAYCLLSDRSPQVPIGAEESRPAAVDVRSPVFCVACSSTNHTIERCPWFGGTA